LATAERASSSKRRRLIVLAAILVPALLVRSIVLATYEIQSGSMAPALQSGDHLLVLRAAIDPEPIARWDIVVMDDRGLDALGDELYDAVVKRVAGLPGERIEVRNGDVWAGASEGSLQLAAKPDRLVRELLIPVHEGLGLPEPWRWDGSARPDPLADGTVRLKAPESRAMAHFGAAITDGDSNTAGELVADTALAVRVGAVDATLLLGLREGADTFRARLASPEAGGASLNHNTAGGEVARAPGFSGLSPGQRILFWNVDNHVRLWVDDELVLAYDYEANTRQPPGTTMVNTPELGLEEGALEVAAVSVLRDLHYTCLGTCGTQPGGALTPYNVLPGDLFLLGDASQTSRDSRHFGALSQAGLLGRPLAIYHPSARARWMSRSGAEASW